MPLIKFLYSIICAIWVSTWFNSSPSQLYVLFELQYSQFVIFLYFENWTLAFGEIQKSEKLRGISSFAIYKHSWNLTIISVFLGLSWHETEKLSRLEEEDIRFSNWLSNLHCRGQRRQKCWQGSWRSLKWYFWTPLGHTEISISWWMARIHPHMFQTRKRQKAELFQKISCSHLLPLKLL